MKFRNNQSNGHNTQDKNPFYCLQPPVLEGLGLGSKLTCSFVLLICAHEHLLGYFQKPGLALLILLVNFSC